jgi:hypothetical protein
MNACKFPGNTSSCLDSPSFGCPTVTAGIAKSAVSCFTMEAALIRESMPRLITMASSTASARTKIHFSTRLAAEELDLSCSVCIIL